MAGFQAAGWAGAVGVALALLTLPQSAGAQTGDVTGTVTAADTGAPQAGVTATANPYTGGNVVSATTNADGTYRLAGLRPGSYHVRFNPGDASYYLDEWFDNAASFENATLVSIADGATTVDVDAELERGASIGGRVTNDAGEPLTACVNLDPAEELQRSQRFTQTDATGRYSFTRLIAGPYRVSFSSCGPDAFQYHALAVPSPPDRFNLAAAEDRSLDVVLSRVPRSQGSPQCADAFDNDGDGLNNFPADPGCSSSDDNEENDPPPPLPPLPQPTTGDDRLTGTSSAETICGLAGNDVIDGLGGDDALFGDACDDRTKLVLGAGALTTGNDHLNGGDGNDKLYGAGGADTLKGNGGGDKLFGGDGNDVLRGGDGNDALDGGKGNDKLTGDAGVNKHKGGAGNDAINTRNRRRETVDCGAGKDSATIDKADKVSRCEKVRRAKR